MAVALNLNLYRIVDFLPQSFENGDKHFMYKLPFENLVQNALIVRVQWIISYFRKLFKISELLKNLRRRFNVCIICPASDSTI